MPPALPGAPFAVHPSTPPGVECARDDFRQATNHGAPNVQKGGCDGAYCCSNKDLYDACPPQRFLINK